MARGKDSKPEEEEEKDDKEKGVSDEALDLVDEDEDEDAVALLEPEDDKGWE